MRGQRRSCLSASECCQGLTLLPLHGSPLTANRRDRAAFASSPTSEAKKRPRQLINLTISFLNTFCDNFKKVIPQILLMKKWNLSVIPHLYFHGLYRSIGNFFQARTPRVLPLSVGIFSNPGLKPCTPQLHMPLTPQDYSATGSYFV